MKLLVIGGGGREHALAWKLQSSPRVREVLVAPGNAGTAAEPGVRNVAVAVDDLDALLALAQSEAIDLTVVGPEVPLVLGIVDRFEAAGLRIFGPRRAAAQLEGSKAYAKAFLARHQIPTAGYAVFTELAPALAHVRQLGAPIVIKADGLKAGKGVVVAMQLAEAEAALLELLGSTPTGAGAPVVIERFLEGEEASYIVLCDGQHALPMASSQDHKRRDAGDLGPNTGGMGAYSPAPVVSAEIDQRVMATVILPTLAGMAADGAPFRGFLYAGLMIRGDGDLQVLEFNVRLGDPEAQPILLRLRSDLLELIEAALAGQLDRVNAHWDPRPAVAVVIAAAGYPGAVHGGEVVCGLDAAALPDSKIFHGATRSEHNQVLTSGGRVLTVCALGADIGAARNRAYQALAPIHFAGGFYRSDIAHLALRR
ncbi:MAG: phosphoribosylamine--glycine ligase [Lysobacterales bacterium CG02_land_8_20_14_3_00_62_12]|nr:MAG: phosphoribosylamine--glycine ligase [Xanthomonadales bacterium CG02_land_8_20_14_3_00_62_12]